MSSRLSSRLSLLSRINAQLKAGLLAIFIVAATAPMLRGQIAQFALPAAGVMAVDFGTVNVGSTGSTQTATFQFTVAGPLLSGAVTVVTEGIVGKDFHDAGSGSCNVAHTYAVNDTCTVKVLLTPAAPGLRVGAIWLKDGTGNILATALLHGIGAGPLAVFDPGATTTILTGLEGSNAVVSGAAVDVAGNVFLTPGPLSPFAEILKVPTGGGSPLSLPLSSFVAGAAVVDGAGNVFHVDSLQVYNPGHGAITFREEIGEVQWNGLNYIPGKFLFLFTSDPNPPVLHVDARGNLYQLNGDGIVEFPWNGNSYDAPRIVNALPADLIDSTSDGLGNIYSTNSAKSLLKTDRSHPPALLFGSALVGTTSSDSPRSFTLDNIGNAPMVFPTPGFGTNPSLSSNFALAASTTCPSIGSATPDASLAPGDSCNYAVKFVPTVSGAVTGALVITDNSLNGTPATQSAPLAGTGLAKYKYLFFSPQSANFGDVGVGTTGQSISVTAFNNTNAIASFATASNLESFTIQGGTCGPISPATKLAPGASCTFSATFSPTAMGLVTGRFTLSTGSNTATFQLKGNGVHARVVVNPSNGNFGDIGVGTTSQPFNITVANYTGSAATYAGSTGMERFTSTGSTCGPLDLSLTVAAGSVCTMKMAFAPTALGPVSGSFTLNTASGPVTYHVSGKGVPAVFAFSPAAAAFGNVTLGLTSPSITVTASNHTASPASFLSASDLTNFNFAPGTCGSISASLTLASNTSCAFQVTFSPVALVPSSGSFTLSTSSGPVSFSVTGTGVSNEFLFSPNYYDFGTVAPGSTSGGIVVTATNDTTAPVSFAPQLMNFPISNNTCGPLETATLGVDKSCHFTVKFAPTSTSFVNGGVLVYLPSSVVVLSLNGNP